MHARVSKAENKLKDTVDLAEKYKSDLESITLQFNEINDYVKDSSFLALKKTKEHEAFVKESTT